MIWKGIAGAALVFCASCAGGHETSPSSRFEWGLGVYPAHGLTNPNASDWDEAFARAAGKARIAHLEVTHGEMSLDQMETLYDLKVPLARKYGMELFLQINLFGVIPDPIAYRTEAVAVAARYQPAYLCLGQEINYVYDNDSSDGKANYAQFVSDLLVTFEEVRSASPATIVFPSFAYEPMRAKHQEFLFEGFRSVVPFFPMTSYPMAFLGLYPGYTFADPGRIPAGYWDVSDITGGDVFVTETGWSTDSSWGGSRAAQGAYVDKVGELLAGNPRVRKVTWITMTDLVDELTADTNAYPGTMGFFTVNGVDKGNWSKVGL